MYGDDILYGKSMSIKAIVREVGKLEGNPFVWVHHRATSVGGTKLRLAHPLDVGDGRLILMQNGTNKNPYNMVVPAESDSEALAELADIMEPDDFEGYILDEVGVVIYAKEGKVYLHRDATRPLSQHTSGLVASEPLIAGEWKSIIPQFSELTYDGGELGGLHYLPPVNVEDVGEVGVCDECTRKHYIPKGYAVCNACVIRGVTQKKENLRMGGSHNKYVGRFNDYDYYGYLEYDEEWETPPVAPLDEPTYTTYRVLGDDDTANSKGATPIYYKKFGLPIRVGHEIYLIARNDDNVEHCAGFMVEAIQRASEDVVLRDGTAIPKVGVTRKVTVEELWAYWEEDLCAYDLQKNVYYLEPPYLSEGDMAMLQYNKDLGSYVIPDDYSWEM
jgi:hypothetical protein